MIDIRNGDCIQEMSNLADNTIDLIVTDPPYKITQRGGTGNCGGLLKTEASKKGKFFKHTDVNNKEWLTQCYRILKEQTHFYLMSNQLNMPEYIRVAEEVGFKYQKALIWDKGNKIVSNWYMNSFEFILFFRKGKAKYINNKGDADILRVPNKKTKINGENIHNSEKPIELMEILVLNSSNEEDIVLDPFMGSGSTGIASIKNNRRFVGIEKDTKYFEIATQRINGCIQDNKNQLTLEDFLKEF